MSGPHKNYTVVFAGAESGACLTRGDDKACPLAARVDKSYTTCMAFFKLCHPYSPSRCEGTHPATNMEFSSRQSLSSPVGPYTPQPLIPTQAPALGLIQSSGSGFVLQDDPATSHSLDSIPGGMRRVHKDAGLAVLLNSTGALWLNGLFDSPVKAVKPPELAACLPESTCASAEGLSPSKTGGERAHGRISGPRKESTRGDSQGPQFLPSSCSSNANSTTSPSPGTLHIQCSCHPMPHHGHPSLDSGDDTLPH
ncbi:semaphorin-6D isoform X2 [Lates japonicus]|uniref:Semaphorin-6D isoform X2 n=1 Tax=Lates japonicus TaxID=270547 RepID=A0AAD3MLD9_LATJO|nr:semaphorin-6D isoform X2 [Lates japonicus]